MNSADLALEQAHIDRAYEQLTRMRERAEHLLTTIDTTDLDLKWALTRRVQSLSDSPRALCFGRIDGDDGSSWHIGRRHVEDEAADPLVVEWRAPVAIPYYQASPANPLGLVRRRQFVVDGRQLLSIGDDHFGAVGRDDGATQVRGRDALLAELERARSGEMLDIVATIQPEQDEVIRRPADGILVVQGGPGSGKTAVGLHRAAFLLYGDDALARANVLVVGPNRTFLGYIGQVLPSLGESAVVQTTLVDLVPDVAAVAGSTRSDRPAVERLKGDGRMAVVLARALAGNRRPDPGDLAVGIGVRHIRVSAEELNHAYLRVGARPIPYAIGRDQLRERVINLVVERYLFAAQSADAETVRRTVRADRGVKRAIDARWPSVAPASLVADVIGKPAVRAAASKGVLTTEETDLLRRHKARMWTLADAPLIDEARWLIEGQSRTYGHVIADEAQDLSPMQLRMLARRVPSGSMTLLGDLAQAIGPWGLRRWEDVTEWLPTKGGFFATELRLGYRSPGEVLDFASRLLPVAAPDVRPTEAVRPSGRPVVVRNVHRARQTDTDDREVAAAVITEVKEVAACYSTVAVIVPDAMSRPIRDALSAVGTNVADAEANGLGHRVTVVRAEAAKGLEFDAVVVVEPAAIVAERPDPQAGLRLLYMALTRPTQELRVVTSGPLPSPLDRSGPVLT